MLHFRISTIVSYGEATILHRDYRCVSCGWRAPRPDHRRSGAACRRARTEDAANRSCIRRGHCAGGTLRADRGARSEDARAAARSACHYSGACSNRRARRTCNHHRLHRGRLPAVGRARIAPAGLGLHGSAPQQDRRRFVPSGLSSLRPALWPQLFRAHQILERARTRARLGGRRRNHRRGRARTGVPRLPDQAVVQPSRRHAAHARRHRE